MNTLTIQTVYEGNDQGDYREVRIIINGVLHITYGDHYHDKGKDKGEGFADGYLAGSTEDIDIYYENLIVPADSEEFD